MTGGMAQRSWEPAFRLQGMEQPNEKVLFPEGGAELELKGC